MREAVLLNTFSFQVPLTGDGWDSRDAGCARLSSSGFLALTKQLQKGFRKASRSLQLLCGVTGGVTSIQSLRAP